VAVMIVGILASIGVSRYLTVRDRGHVAAACADLDLVRRILAYYAADRNSYPPSASTNRIWKRNSLTPMAEAMVNCQFPRRLIPHLRGGFER